MRTPLLAIAACLMLCGVGVGDVIIEDFKLLASDGEAGDYFGSSVSISGDTALIGSSHDNDNGDDSGSAYVYRFDGSQWIEEAKLIASDGFKNDRFGRSVSISGDVALIGAEGYFDNSFTGSAYVFRFNGSQWIQEAKLLASDGGEEHGFGSSVSISGDRALIAATGDDDNGFGSGSAYIFHFDGSQWNEEAKLLASDGEEEDRFGGRVSISNDTALIGAYKDDDNGQASGSAYIFRFNGSQWVEEAKLLASDGAAGDYFGYSVSISGETALIGAFFDDDNDTSSGSAYVYRFNGSQWIEEAKLIASDGMPYDRFGWSVSISGDKALIGAFLDDAPFTDFGSVYIYSFNGSQWIEEAKFLASDGATDDYFGYSVSIDGDTALIGAKWDNDNGTQSGSAYVFDDLEGDPDGDGIPNYADNCPDISNPDQIDSDGDGVGDVCDPCTGSDNIDSDDDGICDSLDNCYLYNPDQADCNENGIGDVCDVADQTSFDCNQNIIPDECESDCDGDGLIDDCDNDPDIDGNGIPDNCEEDCNGNSLPDHWEIKLGMVTDCDGNLVPDECDLADDPSLDCDGNGLINACEIEEDPTLDCNENGVLDSCDLGPSEAKLLASDGAAGDLFGGSVSISGDTALIGAFWDDDNSPNSGSAYVYRFIGGQWVEEAKLLASDGTASDFFGYSVSISGDTALIGAVYDDDNGDGSGSAYAYRFDGSQWVEEAKLLASDGTASDFFAYSVSISGDTALIGAYGDDDNGDGSGSAYVYRFIGGQWVEEAKLLASDGEVAACFGRSVSISGNTALIGAFYDDDNGFDSGSVYVFRFDGTQWTQETKLLASDGEASDHFGSSVSISGNTALIGSPDDDDDGGSSGSAYVFPAPFVYSEDCNANGIPDECDIEDGTSNDVNGNGIPDECEADCNENGVPDHWDIKTGTSEDCNTNGIPDECDIGDGTSNDANGNGIPDECEDDCNANGVPDHWDIKTGWSQDCNANLIPDECDIDDGSALDCNGNTIPDVCDIADGTSGDINGDGIPDECQCLADISDGTTPGEGDGLVNVNDLLTIIGFWGSDGPIGDINFDGTVNVDDLLLVISGWGPCP